MSVLYFFAFSKISFARFFTRRPETFIFGLRVLRSRRRDLEKIFSSINNFISVPLAKVADGKAVGFIADGLENLQGGRIFRQANRQRSVWNINFLLLLCQSGQGNLYIFFLE